MNIRLPEIPKFQITAQVRGFQDLQRNREAQQVINQVLGRADDAVELGAKDETDYDQLIDQPGVVGRYTEPALPGEDEFAIGYDPDVELVAFNNEGEIYNFGIQEQEGDFVRFEREHGDHFTQQPAGFRFSVGNQNQTTSVMIDKSGNLLEFQRHQGSPEFKVDRSRGRRGR